MRIKTLTIHKFRNVEEVSYDLKDINIFSGKNKLGKTNTINALYWLLSNELLEVGKDTTTVKDKSAPRAVIDVEIITDTGTSLRKKFYEKWKTIRGATDLVLDSHVTECYINDCVIATSKFIQEILKVFGCEFSTASKINPVSALIDPLYLGEKVDYKDLRTFIVELVGEMSDDQIVETTQFQPIKNLMRKYLFDTGKLKEGVRKNISNLTAEVTNLETLINSLDVKDYDPEAHEKVRHDILIWKNSVFTNAHDITPLEDKINELETQYMASVRQDSANHPHELKLRELESKLYDSRVKLSEIASKRSALSQEIAKYDGQIEANSKVYESAQNAIKSLEDNIQFLQAMKYEPILPLELRCPKCNTLVNQATCDDVKADNARMMKAFDDSQTAKLKDCDNKIKENKKTIDSVVANHQDLLQKIQALQDAMGSIKTYYDAESDKHNALSNEFIALKGETVQPYISDQTTLLQKQLSDAKMQLHELQTKIEEERSVFYATKQEKLEELNNLYTVLEGKYANLKRQENLEADKRKTIEAKAQEEQYLMLVDDFIRFKINLLQTNVSNVFGDIKFTLLEKNISADTYTQTCYPTLNNIPFNLVNTSDRIKFGIRIIEKIKECLHLADLPIIFDEADIFDSENIISLPRLTHAQVVATLVSDNDTISL